MVCLRDAVCRFAQGVAMARTSCYPSDLTDEEWALVERLLPPADGGGRPEKHLCRTDARRLRRGDGMLGQRGRPQPRRTERDPLRAIGRHRSIYIQNAIATVLLPCWSRGAGWEPRPHPCRCGAKSILVVLADAHPAIPCSTRAAASPGAAAGVPARP